MPKIEDYLKAVVEKNAVMNLTAVKTFEEGLVKHIEDCRFLFETGLFKDGVSVLDVGSGAGFPAAVIAAQNEKINVTALDGTGKRVAFIAETAAALEFSNLAALQGRAELLAKEPRFRDSFDIVCARAVAKLSELCEYCLPFVKAGGYFIAMKSEKAKEEIAEAKNAIKALSGELFDVMETTLSDGSYRTLVIIKKIGPTDEKYPRASAVIKKRSL